MNPVERSAAGPQFASGADQRIDIEIESVGLAAHHLVLRPQRLEAPPRFAITLSQASTHSPHLMQAKFGPSRMSMPIGHTVTHWLQST
jgi:hypothetical protein